MSKICYKLLYKTPKLNRMITWVKNNDAIGTVYRGYQVNLDSARFVIQPARGYTKPGCLPGKD
jgi:hypothetical protein